VLCALALVCAFALGQGNKGYTEGDLALAREEAYNSGYHTGYEEGLTARQQSLYEEAFAAGQAEGYESGYAEGSSLKEPELQTVQAGITPPVLSASVTVYTTTSGSKYHLEGCRHLKSKMEITLEEAKALKLEPCKVCNPPK